MRRLIRMFPSSKLRKIALGGNIKESDVDYIYEGNQIKMVLTNPEKTLHDPNESWNGEYYDDWEQDSHDVIGFIQYRENKIRDIVEIYVGFMEMRNEYRNTRAVKFLMNEFKTKILDKAIEQYGKENVVLSADVVNDDLEGFLKRWSEKVGIKFNSDGLVDDLDDDDFDDFDDDHIVDFDDDRDDGTWGARIISDALKDAGAQLTSSEDDCLEVKNFSIEHYVEVVGKSLNTEIYEMYCAIIDDGDIISSLQSSTTEKGKELFYDVVNNIAWVDGRISEFKNMRNLSNNLEKVLPPVANIKVEDKTLTLEGFIDILGGLVL